MVPLFGLAPSGVWPPPCRHSRPCALTARFHPYPGNFYPAQWPGPLEGSVFQIAGPDAQGRNPGRYVSVPLSVPPASPPGSLGVTQHSARWSPDFPLPRSRSARGFRGSSRPACQARENSNTSRRGGQPAKTPKTRLADVEDSATAVAEHRLAPRPGTLELVSWKRHAAAATEAPLNLGDSHATLG